MHRPRFRPRRPLATGVAVVLAVLVGVRVWQLASDQTPDTLDADTHEVESVTDGDTFRLANGARVRLIGIDTPETSASSRSDGTDQPFAAEAKAFATRAIAGRTVRLEFDKERQDKYGRFLAYVWYRDRDRGHELLLNEELLLAGLARARLRYPYSEQMKRRFRAAEADARQARRGLWAMNPTEPQSMNGRFSIHRLAARIGHLTHAEATVTPTVLAAD